MKFVLMTVALMLAAPTLSFADNMKGSQAFCPNAKAEQESMSRKDIRDTTANLAGNKTRKPKIKGTVGIENSTI